MTSRIDRDPKKDGIRYFKEGDHLSKKDGQLNAKVVPECLRAHILRTCHNSDLASHQGTKRTMLVRTFYWPGMKQDITKMGQGMFTVQETEDAATNARRDY